MTSGDALRNLPQSDVLRRLTPHFITQMTFKSLKDMHASYLS